MTSEILLEGNEKGSSGMRSHPQEREGNGVTQYHREAVNFQADLKVLEYGQRNDPW